MPWEVEVTNECREWLENDLTTDQQAAVDARVRLLQQEGPQLGRPYVERIKGSQLQNLKELRCSEDGALRILFLFDPRRMAVLLLGGDKTGDWEGWYEVNIPRAEAIYTQLLKELREEGEL